MNYLKRPQVIIRSLVIIAIAYNLLAFSILFLAASAAEEIKYLTIVINLIVVLVGSHFVAFKLSFDKKTLKARVRNARYFKYVLVVGLVILSLAILFFIYDIGKVEIILEDPVLVKNGKVINLLTQEQQLEFLRSKLQLLLLATASIMGAILTSITVLIPVKD